MPRIRTPASSALRYQLFPDAEALGAIVETFRDYEAMMAILADVAAGSSAGSNLVLLHEQAYGRVRAQTRLPAQMVVLGLRDFVARRNGEAVEGLPLDDKLYAIKGAASLTIATVAGRITLACDVRGYRPGWQGSIPARLVAEGDALEVRVGVTPRALPDKEEKTMIHEGILSRMGRLIAGFAHSSIDKAEGLDPVAVVEQAIREIDAAAGEARAELGKAMAERHRIDSRRKEIAAELAALHGRIGTAIAQGRDDLARAGIGRQVDFEAQIAALDKALADVDDRTDEGRKALQAVAAARKEAEGRLADLKRSLVPQHAGEAGNGHGSASPLDKAARSASAIARVTGVPAGAASPDAGKLDELERLHRDNLIEERLAAIKAGKGS